MPLLKKSLLFFCVFGWIVCLLSFDSHGQYTVLGQVIDTLLMCFFALPLLINVGSERNSVHHTVNFSLLKPRMAAVDSEVPSLHQTKFTMSWIDGLGFIFAIVRIFIVNPFFFSSIVNIYWSLLATELNSRVHTVHFICASVSDVSKLCTKSMH